MSRKQIVYGLIYVGILITIPGAPMYGMKFVGGILKGAIEGMVEGVDWWSMINPFSKKGG